MEEKNITIEESLAEMNKIVMKLESEETTLEEAFLLYEEGIRKVAECNKAIEDIEKRILVLSDDGTMKEM